MKFCHNPKCKFHQEVPDTMRHMVVPTNNYSSSNVYGTEVSGRSPFYSQSKGERIWLCDTCTIAAKMV